MGKLMSSILKNKARQLIGMYPTEFGVGFEKNKRTLDKLKIFDYSKNDRNHVAGEIVRLEKKAAKDE
jgi:ribosomal protein S17E